MLGSGRQGLDQLQFKLWYCFFWLVLTVSIAVGQCFPKDVSWNDGWCYRCWGKEEGRGLMVVMSHAYVQIHLGNTRLKSNTSFFVLFTASFLEPFMW